MHKTDFGRELPVPFERLAKPHYNRRHPPKPLTIPVGKGLTRFGE